MKEIAISHPHPSEIRSRHEKMSRGARCPGRQVHQFGPFRLVNGILIGLTAITVSLSSAERDEKDLAVQDLWQACGPPCAVVVLAAHGV